MSLGTCLVGGLGVGFEVGRSSWVRGFVGWVRWGCCVRVRCVCLSLWDGRGCSWRCFPAILVIYVIYWFSGSSAVLLIVGVSSDSFCGVVVC